MARSTGGIPGAFVVVAPGRPDATLRWIELLMQRMGLSVNAAKTVHVRATSQEVSDRIGEEFKKLLLKPARLPVFVGYFFGVLEIVVKDLM